MVWYHSLSIPGSYAVSRRSSVHPKRRKINMAKQVDRSPISKALYPQWPRKNVRGFLPIHEAYIKVGEEVLWVPDNVDTIHDVREGGVRRGFITMHSPDKKRVWCRFFKPDSWEIDTVDNSVRVEPADLCWWIQLGDKRIAEIMKELGIKVPNLTSPKKK